MEDHSGLISQHYTRQDLYHNIMDALRQDGVEEDAITREKIAGVDEFHVRGQEVTKELARMVQPGPGDQVLDAGCGLGGPARLLAEEYGCHVTGIDITEEYIRTATKLSELTRLDQKTRFITGSVLALPFADGHFDLAWTQHVQMNIEDKSRFYGELARVLKPGGRLVYYDIFSVSHQSILFPVPWADEPSISHLATLEELRVILAGAGFRQIDHLDQTQKGIAFFTTMFERMKKGDMPRINLRLLIGNDLPVKLSNLLQNLQEGRLTIESGICQKS